MKWTYYPTVLLLGLAVLVSSASAQRRGGGRDGGGDGGRSGGRPAASAPQGGRGNAPNRPAESTRNAAPRVQNQAPRVQNPAPRNVERPKVAAPDAGNRNDVNRGNVTRNPDVRDNAKGTVNQPRRDDVRRNDNRQNDNRVGDNRPDNRTAPRDLNRGIDRNNVNPRFNVAGPNGWRYRQYNNQWWYWLPNNTWVIWRNGAWIPYGGLAGGGYYGGGYNNGGYYDQPYVSGYRGGDAGAGGYLGVSFDPQYQDAAVISRVNANSPAEAVGLQPGDVIRAINGNQVTSLNDPSKVIGGTAAGTEITLSIERDAQLMDVPVVLAQR